MFQQRPPLPAPLSGRAFTLAEGRAAGLSESQLFHGELRRPTRGVRSGHPAPPGEDTVARCRELLPALPPGAVFSHVTALRLLGTDLPRGVRRAADIHVQVARPTPRPRRAGVVAHSRASAHGPVQLRDGLPVSTAEQAWVQLAPELTHTELIVLGDALLRRQGARTSVAELTRAVDRLTAGTRAVRRLRLALPLLRSGTDSCQETRLRLILVDAGLPCPEVNQAVYDSAGRFVALPDLSYRAERIAIEYDGDIHRVDPRTWRRDVARRQALEALGWRTITCTADDIRSPARALAWIRGARSAASR
ncbi:MAG TPA: hypothetical protein VGC57_10365 [Cellulomonas sp.]